MFVVRALRRKTHWFLSGCRSIERLSIRERNDFHLRWNRPWLAARLSRAERKIKGSSSWHCVRVEKKERERERRKSLSKNSVVNNNGWRVYGSCMLEFWRRKKTKRTWTSLQARLVDGVSELKLFRTKFELLKLFENGALAVRACQIALT